MFVDKFFTSRDKFYNMRSDVRLVFVLQDIFEELIKFVKRNCGICSVQVYVDSEVALVAASCVLTYVLIHVCASSRHFRFLPFTQSVSRSNNTFVASKERHRLFYNYVLKGISLKYSPFGLFLCIFAKGTISFVMSVCVCRHGTTRLPLDGFS
jgi:hypothetical protein